MKIRFQTRRNHRKSQLNFISCQLSGKKKIIIVVREETHAKADADDGKSQVFTTVFCTTEALHLLNLSQFNNSNAGQLLWHDARSFFFECANVTPSTISRFPN
jgi:hypothetical protein